MEMKCSHCNQPLPAEISLATCPFCLTRLHDTASGTVDLRTDIADRSATESATESDQYINNALESGIAGTNALANHPEFFGKTLLPEDIETQFVSTEFASRDALIPNGSQTESNLDRPDVSNSQRMMNPLGKVSTDVEIGETLVSKGCEETQFSPRPCSPDDTNQRSATATQETASFGLNTPTVEIPAHDTALDVNTLQPTKRGDVSEADSQEVLSNFSESNRSTDRENPFVGPADLTQREKTKTTSGRSYEASKLTVRPRTVTTNREPAIDDTDYQLIQKLGEGGMGVIYRARQKAIERYVAVKTLKHDLVSENLERQKKFLHEAQITGNLDHPNIVPIHELGISQDGGVFYSMKLVEGTAWQDLLASKSRDENLEILLKVCDAVAFAHSKGVIHRDLKPENTMLGRFGEVLVMDWGLAVSKRIDGSPRFDLGGTPAYMAPEMARHDVLAIGEASDIYLLGAILYQIIVGHPPHPGSTVTECLRNAANNVIIPPADTEDSLVKIAMRAMATNPADRFQEVPDFQYAIREYRRNAESVALTQRADAALQDAISQQDYQKYSRALFGFSDAVELWPDNSAARKGADRARLEYGRCALNNGDFDLAVQLLRDVNDAERPLRQQAVCGKREAEQREKRIRHLRTSVIGVTSIALLVAVALSIYLNKALTLAKKNAEDAENKTYEKILESCEAYKEKWIAQNERMRAEGKETEIRHLNVDLNRQTAKAIKAQKLGAVQNRRNQFKNYPAKLSLAGIRVGRQQDVTRSNALLGEIDKLESDMRTGFEVIRSESPEMATPFMKNWAFRRVKLLGNFDLPRVAIGDRATCVADAQNMSRIAVGTASGKIAIVTAAENRIDVVELPNKDTGSIRAIALSPAGDAVAYSTGNMVFFWRLGDAKPTRLSDQHGADVIRFLNPLPYLAIGIGTRLKLWLLDPKGNPVGEPDFVKGFGGGDIRVIAPIPGLPNQIAALVVQKVTGVLQQLRIFDPTTQQRPLSIDLPTEIGEVTHCAFITPARLLVGTYEGKLIPLDVDITQKPSQINQLPSLQSDVHSTAVDQFKFSNDRSWMVSFARDSPVLQLWQSDRDDDGAAQTRHLCPLLGHRSEHVIGVGIFNGGRQTITVDGSGLCILWDLEKVARRHRISNSVKIGQPIATAFVSSEANVADKSVVTVNDLGLIDRWQLDSSPYPKASDGRRWQFNGHTPDAKLWDAALTPDGRFMVTSAKISPLDRLESSNRQFCLWDLDKREMLARWADNAEGDPSVTISNDGRTVVVGGSQVNVYSFSKGNSDSLRIDRAATVSTSGQAVSVRSDTNEVAAVGVGGLARTFDLFSPNAIRNEHTSGRTEKQIRRAIWSADGEFLFLLLEHGGIHALHWTTGNGEKLRAISGIGLPIGDHRDVDAVVETRNHSDVTLHIALRSGVAEEEKTQFFVFDLDAAGGKLIERPRVEELKGRHWLLPQGATSAPIRYAQDPRSLREDSRFRFVRAGLAGKRVVGLVGQSNTFCVIDLDRELPRAGWVRGGEVQLGSVASSATQRWRCVTSNRFGDLWHITPSIEDTEDRVLWSPIDHDFERVTQVALAPNGDVLGVVGVDAIGTSAAQFWRFDGRIATQLEHRPSIGAFAWHPEGTQFVAWTPPSDQGPGGLQLFGSGEPISLRYPSELNEDYNVTRLAFYRERFSDDGVTSNWHIVLQADPQQASFTSNQSEPTAPQPSTDRNSRVFVIPIPKDGATDPKGGFFVLPDVGQVTAIAASPTENLLAVGTKSGTVSLWLLTPSLDLREKKEAYEVFDFEDHRGSPVRDLAFDQKGLTLFSTDDQGRQYAWLSE
jgi:serine/threonine protein kinase/WD40 repeat protein